MIVKDGHTKCEQQIDHTALRRGGLGVGRSEEAVAAYGELLAHFGDAPEPALQQVVARAREALVEADDEGGRWPSVRATLQEVPATCASPSSDSWA